MYASTGIRSAPLQSLGVGKRGGIIAAIGLMCWVWPALPAAARTCANEQIFALIDRTGAQLRELNSASQPKLEKQLRSLARKRGWSQAEARSKGHALLEDRRTRALDARAATLLMQLDRLGNVDPPDTSNCERLARARSASTELIKVTRAKFDRMSSRLQRLLAPQPTIAAKASPAPPRPAHRPTPSSASRPPAPPSEPKLETTGPSARDATSWETQTVKTLAPEPAALSALPRPVEPTERSYSPAEIRAAGRGLFGSLSAGLASVIDFAFQRYGKPTGYILGQEGGGAFLAGLRYGSGKLVTKSQPPSKVYWQGPSVGYDLGLAGSRVMFLVYSVEDHARLFRRFIAVDGSAFLVGGVGITFLKNGPLVLAPIRTGLGLRIGASVGYLKFTPKRSLNPF